MQIPVLNGVYTDEAADFRTSYPVNLIPVPKEQGISKGYLRPADGIIANGSGPGESRGGINWDDVCYRVMGTKLVSIDSAGAVTTLGDVGGSEQVSMDYSFDRLSIASNGNLFYWDKSTLTQVTDPDLGLVIDQLFADGYFVTTDGESIVVTELSDPTQVNPLKYGSSEVDPDPIKGLLRIRNEVYALNRYTGEVFDNVGGEFFPFRRIDGAQIPKGTVGTHANCIFIDSVAFLGSGRNESPRVYIGTNASTVPISTREIDEILSGYTEAQLSLSVLEARNDRGHQHLWVRLPDQTLVYDYAASRVLGEPVWFHLTSAITDFSAYRAKDLVWCYDKWLIGDSSSASIGYLDDSLSSHWGNIIRWEFGTAIVYNEGRGAIFHDIELVCLTGRIELGLDPRIRTSYSVDGEAFSQEKSLTIKKIGNRTKRILWLQQGAMRNWRIQRFRGDSQSFMSIARLEARVEPLSV